MKSSLLVLALLLEDLDRNEDDFLISYNNDDDGNDDDDDIDHDDDDDDDDETLRECRRLSLILLPLEPSKIPV